MAGSPKVPAKPDGITELVDGLSSSTSADKTFKTFASVSTISRFWASTDLTTPIETCPPFKATLNEGYPG